MNLAQSANHSRTSFLFLDGVASHKLRECHNYLNDHNLLKNHRAAYSYVPTGCPTRRLTSWAYFCASVKTFIVRIVSPIVRAAACGQVARWVYILCLLYSANGGGVGEGRGDNGNQRD